MEPKYGTCSTCNSELKPVWFIEEEYTYSSGNRYKTGRKRKACSHLECTGCLKNICVDDTFDGNWY
jgi:hypothetical protein